MVISDGIPAVPRNRKFSEFRSGPFRGRENNSEFRPWNKNRSKFSEFLSKPFSGRENNSEFRSVEQKIEANSQTSVPDRSTEEKTTQNKTWLRQSLTVFKLRVLVEAVEVLLYKVMLHKGQAKKECIGPSIQTLLYTLCSILMVGNFPKKNNSTEDGIDGTNGYI
jgi:hypothetical protein